LSSGADLDAEDLAFLGDLNGEDFDAEYLAYLGDLNGEDLACLGMHRVSRFDFFTEAERAEWRAEWVRALGALKPRPNPEPPKPRRQRKASLRKMIAEAERDGRKVTSITTPDGVTLHFGEPEPTEASNPWLADLKVTKQ
jgi:hypothetical protein